MQTKRNLFDEPLQPCSFDPMTGYYRDGYCRTDDMDQGRHVVCAQVNDAFLQYSKTQGNDLMTPRYRFPGLKSGDFWCLCASRWMEAYEAGVAPPIKFSATDRALLNYIDRDLLIPFSLETIN